MTNYKMRCVYILISVAPSLCQFAVDTGLKPDVTFGEHNDRFDVRTLIRKQKKQFKNDNILDPQSEEYRRKGNKEKEKEDENNEKDSWLDMFATKKDRKKFRKDLMRNIEDQANQIANTLITRIRAMRRVNDDFAYHDNMESGGGNEEDYEKNLEAFDKAHNLMENVKDLETRRRLQNIVLKLHGQQTRRIDMDPESEILLHYALPVNLKIEGFLQTPSKD